MRTPIALAVLLGLTLFLSGCGDSTRSQLTETAEHFFTAIANKDMQRAHRFLADSLARSTSVEGLKVFISTTGLGQPGPRSWQTSKVDGEYANLTGEVETGAQDATVPVRLNFVHDDAHWKISGVERGVQVASPSGTVAVYAPSVDESARLAQQTTADFATAIQNRDLRGFWANMADPFRQQYSAEQFGNAFSGFIEDNVNLTPATRLAPRFDAPPTVDPNGELSIRGVFPSRPSRVAFRYRYVMQNDGWKPSGITINLVPQG